MIKVNQEYLKIFKNISLKNNYFAATINKNQKQKTFYQILQLPSSSPQSNIRKNYLKLAKIFHPDVYKGSDKGRFQQIKKAYEILSDFKKRQQYDQKIGIKKNKYFSPQQSKNAQQNVSKSNQQVNKRNNFQYQNTQETKIDLDQQYQKFFKKTKQTDFQQIRLHEQVQFREMNQQQRMRFRFRQLYTNDSAQLKNSRTKKFQDLLDDQIDQRNLHFQDIKNRKQTIDKINSQENIKKQKKIVYVLAIVGAIIFYPLLFSFWTKYRLQVEENQKINQIVEQIKRKQQEADIRSRFKY